MSIFDVDAPLGTILSQIPRRDRSSLLTALATKEYKPLSFAQKSIRKVQRANQDLIEIISPFFHPQMMNYISSIQLRELKRGFSETDNGLELILGETEIQNVYDQIELGRKFTSSQLLLLILFFYNDLILSDWLDRYKEIQGKKHLSLLIQWDEIQNHLPSQSYLELMNDYYDTPLQEDES
jgi:hypothetical protein